MTPLTKKALLYGGGGLVAVIVLYYIFRKKAIASPITNNGGGGANPTSDNSKFPPLVLAKQGTRLRAEPSTDSEILDTLDLGVMLYPDNAKLMSDGVWYHTSEGWVRSDVVTLPDSYDNKYDVPLDFGDKIFTNTPSFNLDDSFTLSKSGSSVSATKFTLKK